MFPVEPTYVVRQLGALTCLVVMGCGIEPKTPSEAVEEASTDPHSEIAAGAQVVQLSGGRDLEHVVPPHLEIERGEWVQFITLDHRVHTVSFVPDSLSPEAFEYLDAPVTRLCGPDVPTMPFASTLEEAYMPTTQKAANAMRGLAAY